MSSRTTDKPLDEEIPLLDSNKKPIFTIRTKVGDYTVETTLNYSIGIVEVELADKKQSDDKEGANYYV